jgi:heat shock protein HslJ
MTPPLLALLYAAQPVATEPYRVTGAESPWSLTIAGGRMRYEPGDGATIEVATPPPQVDEMTREYRTSRLTASVFPGAACTVRASRQRYADTVWVRVAGRELQGCGGTALAADDLTDTSWAFVEIDGAAVTADMTGYSLDFGSDHVLGYSRCNRFSARYARADGGLAFTWLGSTMSRCPPPHDTHDAQLRRVFSGQAGMVRISLPDRATLVLTADIVIRLRRVDTGR